MHKFFEIYLIFLKIGAFSFGGGYAMLPVIEMEIIEKAKYLNTSEFLDVLAISQITPGPIAINSATFIGLKYLSFMGALIATFGIVSAPFLFMNIVSLFIEKYKNSVFLENILLHIKPVTVALILSAFLSTFKKTINTNKSIIIFILSFIILYKKKMHPVLVIFLFGFIGIIMQLLGF